MELETEYFRRAIEYYADEANGWGGQTRLSELYGCSNSYINMIIKKAKKPSYKVQNKFAQVLNVSRDDLLKLGKSRPETVEKSQFKTGLPSDPSPTTLDGRIAVYGDCSKCLSLQDEATKRHRIVIEGFQDRELAIKFNEALVEIESLEPSDFQELYENALTKLRKLREKKGIVPQKKKTVNQ